MVTVKLIAAIITFIISGGHIVFQTFKHHESVNPQHGLLKFIMFVLSVLSLVYLIKDMSDDFDTSGITYEPPAIPEASHAEIDYWHTIDSNPTPEDYCAYIEKYPQGQFVEIARHRLPTDCSHLAQQAEAELKAEQKAQTQALVEAELAEKIAHETQALAQEKLRIAAQAQAAAELKARIEAEAHALAEEKMRLASETKNQQQQSVKKTRFVNQLREQKIKTVQVPPHTLPPLSANVKSASPSEAQTLPKPQPTLSHVIEEELQQEKIQEQEFTPPLQTPSLTID